jgi:hypothetical protein
MSETGQNDLTSLGRLIASLPTPARKDKPPQKKHKEESKTQRKQSKQSRRINRK